MEMRSGGFGGSGMEGMGGGGLRGGGRGMGGRGGMRSGRGGGMDREGMMKEQTFWTKYTVIDAGN